MTLFLFHSFDVDEGRIAGVKITLVGCVVILGLSHWDHMFILCDRRRILATIFRLLRWIRIRLDYAPNRRSRDVVIIVARSPVRSRVFIT